MHLNSILAAALALPMLHAFATPVPEEPQAMEPELIFNGVQPIAPETSPASSVFEKRDSCSGDGLYNRGDADTLGRNLQNINPNTLHYLPALSSISWTIGTARVCVYNSYIYENTHVKEWEVGWGVNYIGGKCCQSGNSQCAGGSCTAHGDSGLNLKVVLKNSAYNYC
ncbi:hypothetical protein BCR34DRAFT_584034 [Clohesyomyces aquaticus]|uniref:Uncharacterized protein n=1 Tax=Clohesyomyces aquaticus TaxID=1231657 RepID=A0A1Y2A3G2_9PLEO|nr:hypothetical protein BCR34DRAFT_584034 [Clohesyomyces aquaticus]